MNMMTFSPKQGLPYHCGVILERKPAISDQEGREKGRGYIEPDMVPDKLSDGRKSRKIFSFEGWTGQNKCRNFWQ